jgi:hypothetical protein
MRSRIFRALSVVSLLAAGILSGTSGADAQERATQAFTVRIPPRISVAPPAPTATLSHDGTDRDQVFAAQRWNVSANSQSGATVTFSTDQAFTNTGNAEAKRDAQIELAVSSPEHSAMWTVAVGSDRTHYQGAVPDERATVRAVSSRPGQATFDITVTFLEDADEPLVEGVYGLTVVGTLTAN